MDVGKVVSALASNLRREVLKILAERPDNVLGVLTRLKQKGLTLKYRETVYRALEKLVDSGLADKYYDKEKGICYRLSTSRIAIEVTKDNLWISK